MHKRLNNIILIQLALCSLFFNTDDLFGRQHTIQELDTVSIQLKWFHQFQFAGYYAADITGIYESEGLHVELIEGSLETDPLLSVINRETEFGISHSGLLVDYARGNPVVALNAIFQYSPYVIAVRSDREFRNFGRLADAKIMIAEGHARNEVKSIFFEQGIDADSLEIVSFDFELFKKDSTIDAIYTYVTAEIPLILEAGIDLDIIYPWQYGIDFYGDVLFTSEDYLSKNREIVERFQRATLKGWEYARNNEEEIINYILTLDGVKERGFNRENLKIEAERTWDYAIPDKIPIGFMSETRWKSIYSFYRNTEVINKEIDLEKFIIRPVEPLSVILVRYLNVIIIVSLFVIFSVSVWIITLRKRIDSKTKQLTKVFDERVKIEKDSKEQLLAAFHEKEVILAEVHHRVKNNMALITGLIELQKMEIDNDAVEKILIEAQNRIITIAMIHEELYDHESFMKIPLQSYIFKLIEKVNDSFKSTAGLITIKSEIDAFPLDINYSIPMALILNECLSNCFKHAFVGRESGEIFLTVKNDDSNVFLSITDNGIGFERNPNELTSLGITLIRILNDQISGKLTMQNHPRYGGAQIEISFNTSRTTARSAGNPV